MPGDRDTILEVHNLQTYFFTQRAVLKAVDGVNFRVHEGERVGIVGESGSGKTVTSLSIMGLISPPGRVVGGEVIYQGRDLLKLDPETLRNLRGGEIAMIFQNPVPSLNPVFTVGSQIAEAIKAHQDVDGKEAQRRTVEMLQLVGLSDPERRMRQYPHQFSGGMAQRVMIAMALSSDPRLLIADEPTTALDVTIQAQILELIASLGQRLGTAVILITHNFGIVYENCDHIIVMYGGRVVESASSDVLFERPLHPYTRALLSCIPDVRDVNRELVPLKGMPPNLLHMPLGCTFCPRCVERRATCEVEKPALVEVEPGHLVACFQSSDRDRSDTRR
jgi:oligopeptide transport system ATP-binding protein